MSYTPTTWVTGDTVTSTKMNKIENGIAGAGGSCPYVLCTSSVGNQYVNVGWFCVAKWDSVENEYVAVELSANSLTQTPILIVFGNNKTYFFPSIFPVDLPQGYALVWAESGKAQTDVYTIAGDISQQEYTLNFGSVCDCRVVTGNAITLDVYID